jgi:hypothetical protein
MTPEQLIQYKRPAAPVRVRPYIFLYQTRLYKFTPGIQTPPLNLLPQGNIAEGNRVTWGWIIRVLLKDLLGCSIEFNGIPINIPPGVYEFTLIDSTKNAAGIDSTEYLIAARRPNEFNIEIYATEQILQISEL